VYQINIDYEIKPKARDLRGSAGGRKIDALCAQSGDTIKAMLDVIESSAWFASITPDEPSDPYAPFWFNSWFPPLDEMSLAAMLKENNPETYLEVGSGNSTKFARRAVSEDKLRTKIISIDPFPRAEIDQICDEVIRTPLEDLESNAFANLRAGDVVFIDNSHRSFMNSDVTVFFTEILPSLPSGVIYGMHDIFLPDDYHQIWADRYYNEQYLLAMYLLGGAAGDKILFPASYVARHSVFRERLRKYGARIGLPDLHNLGTGCFWLRRK